MGTNQNINKCFGGCGGESKNEQMDETFTLSRTTSNILKPCNSTIIILEMAKLYLKNIHYLKPSPEASDN